MDKDAIDSTQLSEETHAAADMLVEIQAALELVSRNSTVRLLLFNS